MTGRRFLVCVHDATPAYERETQRIVDDLAQLLGRRLSLGVVPNWHGEWPLTGHPEFCRFVRESCDEILLHGYSHRRRHGWGPTTMLADRSDEMNGLDPAATQLTLESGQRAFVDVFGEPARGFLAPAWQPGHVRAGNGNRAGLEYVLGFFSIAGTQRTIPLSTWTWDCGRWSWLGHVGHGLGRLSHLVDRGVPALAIHPRDLERGFRPRILRLVRELLDSGCQPSTPAVLINEIVA